MRALLSLTRIVEHPEGAMPLRPRQAVVAVGHGRIGAQARKLLWCGEQVQQGGGDVQAIGCGERPVSDLHVHVPVDTAQKSAAQASRYGCALMSGGPVEEDAAGGRRGRKPRAVVIICSQQRSSQRARQWASQAAGTRTDAVRRRANRAPRPRRCFVHLNLKQPDHGV